MGFGDGCVRESSAWSRWRAELFSSLLILLPQVFEGVPPAEQTAVAVHLRDGAIRLFAPSHPGAFVVHLGELDIFSALTSDNPAFNLKIVIASLNALMTDDFLGLREQIVNRDLRSYTGAKFWKV
jgi:autophagy-related protein 2